PASAPASHRASPLGHDCQLCCPCSCLRTLNKTYPSSHQALSWQKLSKRARDSPNDSRRKFLAASRSKGIFQAQTFSKFTGPGRTGRLFAASDLSQPFSISRSTEIRSGFPANDEVAE